MFKISFSFLRLWAIIAKEFIQMKRDRITFAMIIGIPLIQLTLFGFAINTNPKNLPTGILQADSSIYTRAIIQGLENTDYFRIVKWVKTEKEADRMLATGEVQFMVTIPADFTRRLFRKEQPEILVEADATDPVATGNALAAIDIATQLAINESLRGSVNYLRIPPIIVNASDDYVQTPSDIVNVVVHAKYNPEEITQYNIVPGLLGVVLTMTMVVITSLAITRERERGTMENLLATPVQPLEVMIGKIIPYITIGYLQVILILLASYYIFKVPIEGSLTLLLFITLFFIAANLSIGLMYSSIAKNQLQAMQMAFFYFLPSILLSGFMFPFRGMPEWAQMIGQVLPLTHFVRIVRGILLKGNGFSEIFPEFWPILLFTAVVMFIGLKRYRRTLD